MAIGSNGEIGVRFGQLKDMSEEEVAAWYEFMRTEWSPNLMSGYATIIDVRTGKDYYEGW